MRRSKHFVLLMVGLLLVGGLIAGSFWYGGLQKSNERSLSEGRKNHETLVRPTPPADDYVGGKACRSCHQQIWERFQSHPMAHSAARIQDAVPIEAFDRKPSFEAQTPVGVKEYRVEQGSAGQVHSESLIDRDLGTIYDQRVPMEFAIGSGHLGRSYLLLVNDCLFMSPITWYSQSQIWDLSPGYAPENRSRFERRIIRECIVCHVDRVTVDRGNPDRFPAPAIVEAGISCERCHGPGGSHVAYRERALNTSLPGDLGDDPIVNPGKLDHERREAVCWQCHFSVGQRVTRYGRLDSDFRPGMYFDDIWVGFEREARPGGGALKPVSQVQQMQVSKCFQGSEGRFSCLSCHDPHFAPSEAEKVEFYRKKCLACHTDRGCAVPTAERTRLVATDSCVSCHMPSRNLDAVPHASQTDHRVLRKPESETTTAATNASTADLAILTEAKGRLPRIEQERALGMVFARLAEETRDPDLARAAEQKLLAILPSVPDDDDVMKWLGACESQLGRHENARNWWLEMLKQNPRHERALNRLARLSIKTQDIAAARDYLVRSLEINPWNGDFQVRLAAIHANQGDFAAAVECANKALKVNPTLSYAHNILAEVYERQGNLAEARRHQVLSEKLGPPK